MGFRLLKEKKNKLFAPRQRRSKLVLHNPIRVSCYYFTPEFHQEFQRVRQGFPAPKSENDHGRYLYAVGYGSKTIWGLVIILKGQDSEDWTTFVEALNDLMGAN